MDWRDYRECMRDPALADGLDDEDGLVERQPRVAAAAPPTLAELLLAHLREMYDPLFRRENTIFSNTLSRLVEEREAGRGPSSALLRRLVTAADCPRGRDGTPSVPGLLRTWRLYLGTAWADLLAQLPEEAGSAEVAAGGEEELRRLLAGLLGRVVAIGRRVGERGETEVQAASLIDCALRWAIPGAWGKIRSYWLWSRLEGDVPLPADRCLAEGERRRRLRVALRIELASQLGVRPLSEWPARRLTELCEHYALGRAIRIGGQRCRAVELSRGFLADLLGEPGADREPGEEG